MNAAGAWGGRIAALAGCQVRISPGKGIMVAANHRLVQTVVNRCEMPADGDILVPIRTVSVIGTTDIPTEDPDDWEITRAEIDQMLEAGENLVPGFRRVPDAAGLGRRPAAVPGRRAGRDQGRHPGPRRARSP